MIFLNRGVLQLTSFGCSDKNETKGYARPKPWSFFIKVSFIVLECHLPKKNFLQGSYIPLKSSIFRILYYNNFIMITSDLKSP